MAMLEGMAAAIAHRGPDDSGFHMEGPIGFAFRRLSIVDIEGGHQPMGSPDGRVWAVFNGEIYNHKELRRDLAGRGCQFRTSSDTEVLLRLYETEGLNGLRRLNGMFAIAIWDSKDRELHLIRDRMGIKPIYFALTAAGLLFGSEIKAIIASGLVAKQVNPGAIWDYLTFRYVPAPHTIWNGICKLPPAHILTMRDGERAPRISRWWKMEMSPPPAADEKRDADYEEEFGALFESAVDLRMRADVPVGITLSGGLDSTAVVSAARAASDQLTTFSVAFEGSPETDELAYARQVAEHFHTDHHEIRIDAKQFLDFLPDLVWHTDEPLADLASVPLFYVTRLAGEHVTVVLSGEGADEVFAGYNFEVLAKRWQEISAARASLPTWAGGRLGRLAAHFSPGLARHRQLAGSTSDQRLALEPLAMTNYLSGKEKLALLQSDDCWPDSHDKARELLRMVGDAEPLNQALYLYCQDWLVEDLLMKADKMSMANSIELRTPFLDYRLVEWAAQLPVRLKAGPSPKGTYRSKEILRRYAQPRLPAEIIERPKQGFPVPVYGWLSNKLSGWANDMLLSSNSKARDWFDGAELQKLVSAGTREDAGMMDQHRLWNNLILEQWMRTWLP